MKRGELPDKGTRVRDASRLSGLAIQCSASVGFKG